ncbi:hypothetical protein KQI52_06745 [bacterium]|nr:hypothetical protein [bacterium]
MAPANQTPRGQKWWSLAVVVVLGLTMLRCSLPTDLGAPEWDIPFSVAFSTERYGINDLLDSTSLADSGFAFEEGEDGVLMFIVADTLDSVRVGRDDMFLGDHESVVFDVPTDTIVIPFSEELDESYSLDDMFTTLGFPTNYNNGDQVPLPPGGGTWNLVGNEGGDVEFDQLDSMKYAHIVDGQIQLVMENNTDIEFDDLQVTVMRERIHEPGVFVPLTVFDYGQVSPNDQMPMSYFMYDDTLTARLRMKFTANGQEQIITANHSDALNFTLIVDTLKADYAEAVIARQKPQSRSEIIYLNDDLWIKRAIVDSGFVYYNVVNETDVNTIITLTFPRVFRDDGDVPYDTTFEMTRTRPGEDPQFVEGEIDIQGMRVRYPQIPETPGTNQEFHVQTTVTILSSGEISPGVPDTSVIAVGNSVISTFQLSDLVLSTAEGVFRDYEYDITEEVVEITQFEDEEQLQQDLANNLSLRDVNLILDMQNNIEAPMELTLNIEASNSVAFLQAETTVVRNLGRRQERMVIEDISNILNILPDEVAITGTVRTGYEVFGVPDTAYALNLYDYIVPAFRLEAPVSYVMSEDTPLRPPVQLFEEPINPDIKEFSLYAIVENAMPVGGYLYLMAGKFGSEEEAEQKLKRDDFEYYGITFIEGGESPTPMYINPPTVDDDGRPVGTYLDTLFTRIPSSRMKVFAKDSVYTRQVLVLEATDTSGVVINVEDYLDVSVIGEVLFKINGDD